MATARYYVIADKDCTLTFKRADTAATLQEVDATAGSMVQVELDPDLSPYVVADRSDVECGAMVLKPGLNTMRIAYTMTTGGTSDETVPMEFQMLSNEIARISGRVNFVTGNPNSILQLDAEYVPLQAIPFSVYAITTSALSITAGSISTTGVVSVNDAVGGVSSDRDLQFDVTYRVQ